MDQMNERSSELPDLRSFAMAGRYRGRSHTRMALVAYNDQIAGLLERGYNWTDAYRALEVALKGSHPDVQITRAIFRKHCRSEGLQVRPKSYLPNGKKRDSMATINLVLQGKGGVGKSYVATLLAQYLTDKGVSPVCIDTDPVNATLASYHSFKAERFEVMDGDDIDKSRFDALLDKITQLKGPEHQVIIDSGASTFVPLSSYLLRYQVADYLMAVGHTLVIHTVITGGEEQTDTIQGLLSLLKNYPKSVTIVVWLNPFHGRIEHAGKGFTEMKIYKDHQERISALVRLPELGDLERMDVQIMQKARQTFTEAEAPENSTMMGIQRHRLSLLKKKIYEQMTLAKVA